MEVIESFFDKKIDKTNTKCYNIIKIEVVSNRRLRMSMNFDEIDKEVDEIIASNAPIISSAASESGSL